MRCVVGNRAGNSAHQEGDCYSESTEGVFAHCTMAEGELSSVDFVYTVLPLSSSVCPELSFCPVLAMEAVCELSALIRLPSITTTMEVVPLALVLTVLQVALWCV